MAGDGGGEGGFVCGNQVESPMAERRDADMRSVTASRELAILSTSLSTVVSMEERYDKISSIDPNGSPPWLSILEIARCDKREFSINV